MCANPLNSEQALRYNAERMVRNLCGSDRMTSAQDTLALLDEIKRLSAALSDVVNCPTACGSCRERSRRAVS